MCPGITSTTHEASLKSLYKNLLQESAYNIAITPILKLMLKVKICQKLPKMIESSGSAGSNNLQHQQFNAAVLKIREMDQTERILLYRVFFSCNIIFTQIIKYEKRYINILSQTR